MKSKADLHKDIMDFLNDYLENTPVEILNQEIDAISKNDYTGVSAVDYFNNFHTYYFNLPPEDINNNLPDSISTLVKQIGVIGFDIEQKRVNYWKNDKPSKNIMKSKDEYIQ